MEPTLLPVKPGTLTKQDKATIRKAGVIVVEHENPTELRLIKPSAEIGSSDLLRCAMQALAADRGYGATGAAQRETFAKLVAEFLGKPGASNTSDEGPRAPEET